MQQDTSEKTAERSTTAQQKRSTGGSAREPEHTYKVRQVTSYQASWMEQERGEEGLFTIQLILDHGVAEYTLVVESDDMDPMLKLLRQSKSTSFDLERKVLMFANLDAA